MTIILKALILKMQFLYHAIILKKHKFSRFRRLLEEQTKILLQADLKKDNAELPSEEFRFIFRVLR